MANEEIDQRESNHAVVTALAALHWILQEPARADRLLALTGLSASGLRSGAEDPAVLAAILGFLEGHEPDLVACAKAIHIAPAELISVRHWLEAQAT